MRIVNPENNIGKKYVIEDDYTANFIVSYYRYALWSLDRNKNFGDFKDDELEKLRSIEDLLECKDKLPKESFIYTRNIIINTIERASKNKEIMKKVILDKPTPDAKPEEKK